MSFKILLVDDDLDVAQLLGRLLERHGCEVQATGKPSDAIQIASQFQPQAIGLDIGMPEMDGYTLARSMRQVAGLADCRIVAITAHPPDAGRLKAAGINAHFLKPVAAKALSEALRGPLASTH